jgi:hypothetical protein
MRPDKIAVGEIVSKRPADAVVFEIAEIFFA